MLHSAEQHSGGPVGFVPLIVVVFRSRIGLESVYFKVQSCSTTFELWKTLSDTYEKKIVVTKIYLIRHLYNLRMKEADSV